MYVSKLDTWYFSISAILNYEISVETNVGNHDAIFDCVGHHGYRRSGHMQYTLPRAADWLVSLFLEPPGERSVYLFIPTCVGNKIDSAAHFLPY